MYPLIDKLVSEITADKTTEIVDRYTKFLGLPKSTVDALGSEYKNGHNRDESGLIADIMDRVPAASGLDAGALEEITRLTLEHLHGGATIEDAMVACQRRKAYEADNKRLDVRKFVLGLQHLIKKDELRELWREFTPVLELYSDGETYKQKIEELADYGEGGLTRFLIMIRDRDRSGMLRNLFFY